MDRAAESALESLHDADLFIVDGVHFVRIDVARDFLRVALDELAPCQPCSGEADPPGPASVPEPEVRTGDGEPGPGGSSNQVVDLMAALQSSVDRARAERAKHDDCDWRQIGESHWRCRHGVNTSTPPKE